MGVLGFSAPKPIATTTHKVAHYTKVELNCLMRNIYHEARGEPLVGMVAVAKVTLNRAKGSSICAAVYAPYQFSWTLKPRRDPVYYPYEIYQAAHLAAYSNFPATHYHATHVKPVWSKKLTKLKQIGNHIFYV